MASKQKRSKTQQAIQATGGLQFTDLNLSQVRDAIEQECGQTNEFNCAFWEAILTNPPINSYKSMMNRSLPYWVNVFNRWQELKRSKKCREQVAEEQLIVIMNMPFMYLKSSGILELYSAPGQSVRVSILVLITSGVLLSRLMSRKMKMRFIFGLFDSDDAGSLDKAQFVLFLASFSRALAPVFKVEPGQIPSARDLKETAEQLFVRIESAAETMHIASQHDRNALSYETIWEWLSGKLSEQDVLALPYKLAIERFCPEEVDGAAFADEFWGAREDGFRLNHKEPVVIPEAMTTCPRHDTHLSRCQFLNRAMVILARDVFRAAVADASEIYGPKRPTELKIKKADLDMFIKRRGHEPSEVLKTDLTQALSKLPSNIALGAKATEVNDLDLGFVDYLRVLCPCAQPRHIMMYEKWCREFDELQAEREKLSTLYEAAQVFVENNSKPVMPYDEVLVLQNQFDQMDNDRNGFVNVRDLEHVWGWAPDDIQRAIRDFDLDGDSCVDRVEFLRMMCPPEYRLPEMSGEVRELLGAILTTELAADQEHVQDDVKAFVEDPTAHTTGRESPGLGSGGGGSTDRVEKHDGRLQSIWPEVPAWLLKAWEDVFTELDIDKDKTLDAEELAASGIVSKEVAQAFVKLLDADHDAHLSLEDFLQAACRASGFRMPLIR